MQLDRAIARARCDAKFQRKEARRFRAQGATYCADLADTDADMLEALADAAEKSRQIRPESDENGGQG